MTLMLFKKTVIVIVIWVFFPNKSLPSTCFLQNWIVLY